MKLHREKGGGNYIQSFTPGGVTINGELIRRPLIVTPEQIIHDWSPPEVAALTLDDLRAALDLDPEVIILGTGLEHRFVSNHVVTAILRRGVGCEVMATAAACRTYNILMAEERRVVAALVID